MWLSVICRGSAQEFNLKITRSNSPPHLTVANVPTWFEYTKYIVLCWVVHSAFAWIIISLPRFTVSCMKLGIFLLYNNLFIYQALCTLIYRRRSLYSFLIVPSHQPVGTGTFEWFYTPINLHKYNAKCHEIIPNLYGLRFCNYYGLVKQRSVT